MVNGSGERSKVIAYMNSGSLGDLKTLKHRKPSLFNRLRSAAVTAAWEREAWLVSKGSCTRKWTPDQQKELLETGKVEGFQGHHMKSASAHPEYAGAPYNIQFLAGNRYGGKYCEHIYVHNLNPDHSTNGWYDTENRTMHSFGDGPPELRHFELKEKYLELFAKENQMSLDEAAKHFSKKRIELRKAIEKHVSEQGLDVVYKKLPTHPVVVEMIFEQKVNVVNAAWREEVRLVRAGKGTRQWTRDEQRQLIKYGRVHGYELHHMKSSFTYPQYSGDVNNIQFLRNDNPGSVWGESEHLDAHGGDPSRPTNGRYNPETRTTISFGDAPPVRDVIDLSYPFIKTMEYQKLCAGIVHGNRPAHMPATRAERREKQRKNSYKPRTR